MCSSLSSDGIGDKFSLLHTILTIIQISRLDEFHTLIFLRGEDLLRFC